MTNIVYNQDCMEGMKQYPDKYFDLAIVDPPYFKEYGKIIYPGAAISTTGIKRNRFESKNWEVPNEGYFQELYRVSKNQIIWGINYYERFVNCHGRIIWDKVNDESGFSKAEIASCSLHNSVQMFRFMWNGMLQGNMKEKETRIHPTQKPIALYKWLLKNYAKSGDKILDTHLGSGSSRIAAYDLEFDFTGFEIDKDYYEAQEERFKKHIKQIQIQFPKVEVQQANLF